MIASKRYILGAERLEDVKPLQVTIRLLLLNSLVMLLCVVVGMLSRYQEPGRYFREGRLITWISTFQLIAVGYICGRIWEIRRSMEKFKWSDGRAIWKIVCVGFYFLAFDEIMKVHEAIDRYSHKLLGVLPNGITDHADDAIICFYGLVGLSALVTYWREVPPFIASIVYFIGAFIMSLLSIVLDFVSADRIGLNEYFHDKLTVEWYMTWLGLAEEFFKIYAEVFFIGAALWCFVRAIELARFEAVSNNIQRV